MESLPKKPPTPNPYKSSKSDCEEKAKMLLFLHILPSATVYQQRRSARSQDCTSNTTSNLSEKKEKSVECWGLHELNGCSFNYIAEGD